MSQADSRPVYDVFHVSLGWCAGARSGKGVCAFVLPVRRAQVAEEEILAMTARSLRPGAAAPRRATSELRRLAEAAARYFDGETVRFEEFPVDLSSGTSFQQRVWGMIGRIPRGQVRTYRWIGVEIGRPEAARAIGGAVGANPIPLLIPCHRVVGSDGSLVGFSAAGGIGLKVKMLGLEKVRMRRAGTEWRVTA
ncbi:MAG: methylated-DNA--[protein]-cysteine S-methyltransferase [Candidatus Brocadiia bacterium]